MWLATGGGPPRRQARASNIHQRGTQGVVGAVYYGVAFNVENLKQLESRVPKLTLLHVSIDVVVKDTVVVADVI